jgi:type IV pilus assembly protein PilM
MIKLFQQKYSPIGLEISDDCIRMIQTTRAHGKWRLHCMAEKERRSSEQTSADRNRMLVQYIQEMLSKHAFHGRQVVFTLSNREVDILPVYLQVPDEGKLEEAILAGAETRLAYPVEAAVIDYLPIDGLQETKEGDRLFWIIAAHKEGVEQQIRQLTTAGLHSQAVDIQPCALVRAFASSGLPAAGTILLIHIGDRDTLFLLIEQKSLLAHRVYLKGYQDIADKLCESLELEKDSAMSLLSEYGFEPYVCSGTKRSQKDTQDIGQVTCEVIMPVYEEIREGLRSFFTYCQTVVRELAVEQICLSGKAGLINSLDKMIEQNTELQTVFINPLAKADDAGIQPSGTMRTAGPVFNVPLGLTLRE